MCCERVPIEADILELSFGGGRIPIRRDEDFVFRGLCMPDLKHTCESRQSVVKVIKSIVLRIPKGTLHEAPYMYPRIAHTLGTYQLRLIT